MIDTVPLERAANGYARIVPGRKYAGKEEDGCVMETKEKRNYKARSNLDTGETGEVSVGHSALDGEIRRRAYEIYRERGEQPGRELDDWLQAERELKRGMFLNPECGSATADIDTLTLLNCHDLGDC
jgi:Protein of unknown function (DUF2934)